MKNRKIHYAWVIFIVCYLMVFVALGFGSATKSIYLEAITGSSEMEIARGLYSFSDTFRFVATAIANLLFGALVARFGAKKLIGAGFSFLILSFVVLSFSYHYWQFYLSGALLGIGFTFTSTTIVALIVEKWFTGKKGTMMGIILSANALGGLASEQIISRIVYGMNNEIPVEVSRWRAAALVSTVIFAVAAVLVLIFIRNDPRDIKLAPLGEDLVSKKRGLNWRGYEKGRILHSASFIIFAACTFLSGFCLQAMANISRTHLKDIGIPEDSVKLIFSAYWIVLVLAKVGSGFLYDKFGLRVSYAVCTVSSIVASGCMLLVTKEMTVFAWIYCFIAAFAMPLETVMVPLVVSDLFGQRSYSAIIGYYMAFNYFGFAAGVPVSGFIFDSFGSFKYFYWITLILMILVTVFSQIFITVARKQRDEFLHHRRKEKKA